MRTFETLFHPQSIAIIGASSHSGNVGNDVLKNIVESGFQGEIFPINPKAKELYGKKV
ncbi:MAG: acetyl CoA synthetase, partial [Candidatus Moranbacteria bacterium]|nr:acetyl CoA synthetase [Candidatus Moranbacteria bacterium]